MSSPYAPLELPNFREGAFIENEPIATVRDLEDLRRFLLDMVGQRVQELVFNNGTVVVGGSAGSGVLPSDLWNHVAIKEKPIHQAGSGDALLGASFQVFQSSSEFLFYDTNPVILNFGLGNQDTSQIRQAGFVESSYTFRGVKPVFGQSGVYRWWQIDVHAELNADKVSYSVRLDYQRWNTDPAPSGVLDPITGISGWNQDISIVTENGHAPDYISVNQLNTTTARNDIFAQTGNYNPTAQQLISPFSLGYYALAVK